MIQQRKNPEDISTKLPTTLEKGRCDRNNLYSWNRESSRGHQYSPVFFEVALNTHPCLAGARVFLLLHASLVSTRSQQALSHLSWETRKADAARPWYSNFRINPPSLGASLTFFVFLFSFLERAFHKRGTRCLGELVVPSFL